MTEEEKFKAIQEARKVATEQKEEPNGGVQVDPPTEDKEEPKPNPTPEEQQPPKEEDKEKGTPPAEKESKAEHALAEMRVKNKRVVDGLKGEIAELKKQIAEFTKPKETQKTRQDFQSDEEYGAHLRSQIEKEVTEKVLKELAEKQDSQKSVNDTTEKIRTDLVARFGDEIAKKVCDDMDDPDSEMSLILTDEKGKAIAEAVFESDRRSDLLALMQAQPKIFQDMLTLSPKRQEFAVYKLEDQINARYAKLQADKKAEEEKKQRAENLPAPGVFGVNGTGNQGISGLSSQARVDKYKAEMRKAGII